MAKQVPFINREDELAQIEKLIQRNDTRCIIGIHGEGGVGKTRLLAEVKKRYFDNSRLFIADILDFDDRGLRIPENTMGQIARRLGDDALRTYHTEQRDLLKMRHAKVSAEQLERQKTRIRQTLADSFNQVSSQQRVVFLLDTIEKLKKTREEREEVWKLLVEFMSRVHNALFLLAGRNAETLLHDLPSYLAEDATLIKLQPFGESAEKQYLQQKQRLLHIRPEPELDEKLLLLTNGRPILIDLAVEWRSRDLPGKWLTQTPLQEIQGLSSKKLKQERKKFEARLVRHITQIRTPDDQLILMMSRVFPLNVEMIGRFLPQSDSQKLFDDAQTYSFVKSLPDGYISLHDEMRRMIEEHIWEDEDTDIDPDRQREDSQLAIEYLELTAQEIKDRITQLADDEENARLKGDIETELDAFAKQKTREEDYWTLREQQLFHTWFINPQKGLKLSVALLTESTKAYRLDIREKLLTHTKTYSARAGFSSDQMYEVDSSKVKFLLDDGEYSNAKKLTSEVLERNLKPEQNIDMLIQLANIKIRLGDFSGGVETFKKATKNSREENLTHWLNRALTGLGWGYRLIGRLDKAHQHYREALALSISLGDTKREAMLLNNLALVSAYQSNYKAAKGFCRQAERLWHTLREDRGLGALYVVYGEMYRRDERYDQALQYYQLALDIFQPQDDKEWLSQVYGGIGATDILRGEPEKGKAHLQKALELKIAKDKAWLSHWLGRAILEQGENQVTIDAAKKAFKESYDEGKGLPDLHYQLHSLWALARIDTLNEDSSQFQWFIDEYNEYKQKRPDVFYPSAEALLRKFLGDLALNNTDFAQAIKYYREAFPLLAEHITYGPYQLQNQLDYIDQKLSEMKVPQETIKELGDSSQKMWEEKGLDENLTLRYFLRWKKGEAGHAQ